MSLSDLADALGGEVGGTVEADEGGWRWTCSCGRSRSEYSEAKASLALYFCHRSGHVDVIVTMDVGLEESSSP